VAEPEHIVALRGAYHATVAWCDHVRQRAERRMGVEAGDPAVVVDAEYGRALGVLSAIEGAVRAAEQLDAELAEASGRQCPSVHPEHGPCVQGVRHPNALHYNAEGDGWTTEDLSRLADPRVPPAERTHP